jgi:OmpA-OmpF porin, OOP family
MCDDSVDAIVFFDFDSSDLTGTEAEAINYIMTNAEPCRWRSLSVIGHTDRAGSDAYNEALSQRRAQTVEAALRSRGVTLPVEVDARGESEPRVPTVDGERNPQNRRVEISGTR